MEKTSLACVVALALCVGCGSKKDDGPKAEPGGAKPTGFTIEPDRPAKVGDTVVAMRPPLYDKTANPEHQYVSARVDAIEGESAKVLWYTNNPGSTELVPDLSGHASTAPINELYPVHPKGSGPDVKAGDPVLFNRPYENTGWQPATVVRTEADKLVLKVADGEFPIDAHSVVKIGKVTTDALALMAEADAIADEGRRRYPRASEGYVVKAGDAGLFKSRFQWGEGTVGEVKGGLPNSFRWKDFRAEDVYAKEYGPRTFFPVPQVVTGDPVEVGRLVLVPRPVESGDSFWAAGKVQKVEGDQLTVLDSDRAVRTFKRAEVVLLEKERDAELSAALDAENKR